MSLGGLSSSLFLIVKSSPSVHGSLSGLIENPLPIVDLSFLSIHCNFKAPFSETTPCRFHHQPTFLRGRLSELWDQVKEKKRPRYDGERVNTDPFKLSMADAGPFQIGRIFGRPSR